MSLENYLSQFTESDWLAAIDELLPCVHAVDRDALQIWFRFFPLELKQYLDGADDREEAVRGLALQGDFDLKDQIDSSHHFLYGHRYWSTVKRKIALEADEFKDGPGLLESIKSVAMRVSEKLKTDRSHVNAIAAIGLATLNQVGSEAFQATPGETAPPRGVMSKAPDAIVAERAKDASQGLFSFLKTVDKKFSVAYANGRTTGKFAIMNEQEIAGGSAADRSKDWRSGDSRCWEGVVPVECLSASCGTCWVGVIGGKEKLSEVARRERRAMSTFGYNQPDEPQPFLRLACQAKAAGNVSIVVPPWNGVFGKKVRGNVEEVELEPNTTSAKKLREVVKTATQS